jgi:hypothetical protein
MSNVTVLNLPTFAALKAVTGNGLRKFYADNQAASPADLVIVAACTIDGDQGLGYKFDTANGGAIPNGDSWLTGATRLLELPF